MTRAQRFAYFALLAALLAPSLALVPRAAHVFYAGQSLLLAPLALLALLLAWTQGPEEPRLPRAFTPLLLGVLALAALTAAQAYKPLWLGWAKGLPAAADLYKVLLRTVLGLAALGLAYAAWRAPQRPGLPRALQALGLGLAAWWSLAGAFSFRPDLAVATLTDWLAYPMLFAAVWMLGGTPERRRRLALLLLLGGLVNAAYGLLQAGGVDPMPWTERFGGRAAGFLGNPNYLGGHLALLLPLSLALALDTRSRALVRWGRWCLLLLLAAALVATQTRGAWAGAALGVGLVLALALQSKPGLLRRNRRPLLASGLLLLLGGGLYLGTHPQALRRVVDVLQGRDVEAQRRGFLMRKTAQLAAAHPLLGVGPGNYRVWFPSVQVVGIDPAQLSTQPYILSEHGHNDALQMAADAGVPAALAWLALLLLLARELLRGLKRRAGVARAGQGGEDLLGLGVLGALAGLSVHGLANFPFLILPTQAAAWALAALGLRALAPPPALGLGEEELVGEEAYAPPPPAKTRLAWALVALLAFGTLTALQSRHLLKDMHWWVGEGELGLNNTDMAAPMLLRALAYDRREDRLWKLHGRAEFDRGMIWNSIGSLRETVRLNPFDGEAAVRLGRACVENKLFEEAEKVLFNVSVYAPNLVDVWEPLAAAYFQQGKFAEAVTAYDWMIYFNANTQAAFANKAAAQGGMGQLPQALMTLRSAEQRYPADGKIKINLAITYLKLGLRAEARASWKEAALLLPSDPQVDQLRKVLR